MFFIPKKHLSSTLRKMLLKCFFGINTRTQRKFQPEGPTPGRKVVGFLLRLAVAIYHYLSRRVILNLQKKMHAGGDFAPFLLRSRQADL